MLNKILGSKCVDDGTLKSKFARFAYYFFATFYILLMIMSIISTIININNILMLLFVAIIIPLIIRGLYSIVLKANNLTRE